MKRKIIDIITDKHYYNEKRLELLLKLFNKREKIAYNKGFQDSQRLALKAHQSLTKPKPIKEMTVEQLKEAIKDIQETLIELKKELKKRNQPLTKHNK